MARSRHRYRCRDCRREGRSSYNFTLRYAPSHYKRPVRCPRCKSRNVYSREAAYQAYEAKRRDEQCLCPGVPHPHRRGSHVLCHHAPPERRAGWTEQELQEYEQRLFGQYKNRTSFN